MWPPITVHPALTGTGTVTVTVSPVNDAPLAGNDSDTTAEDTAKTITATTLLANDTPGPATATDEAGQTLTVVAVSATMRQRWYSYARRWWHFGDLHTGLELQWHRHFHLHVRDNGSPTAETTATVTMTVTAVNDAPTAGADTAGTSKGVAVTISQRLCWPMTPQALRTKADKLCRSPASVARSTAQSLWSAVRSSSHLPQTLVALLPSSTSFPTMAKPMARTTSRQPLDSLG